MHYLKTSTEANKNQRGKSKGKQTRAIGAVRRRITKNQIEVEFKKNLSAPNHHHRMGEKRKKPQYKTTAHQTPGLNLKIRVKYTRSTIQENFLYL